MISPISDTPVTFDDIPWKDRLVLLVFDSDVGWWPELEEAPRRLCEELRQRCAWALSTPVPSVPGEKIGLDDYLVRFGKESFLDLEASFLPLPTLNKSGRGKNEGK